MRDMHPLRAERWTLSDLNPWLAWLGPAADSVREQRAELDADSVPRQTEAVASELISATLDCYRAVRDAASEAMFFQTFGSMFALTMQEDARGASASIDERSAASRELVGKALASIGTGGYDAAVARIGVLLARNGEPLPLERLAMRAELRADYADLLPDLAADEWRRLRGVQEIIVQNAPQQALSTLPGLLASKADRERLQRLAESLMNDPRMQDIEPSAEQRAMLDTLRAELALAPRARNGRSSDASRRTTRSAGARAASH